MSSTAPPLMQQQQPGQQQSGPGLPPTGLQQQLNSLQQGYNQARTARIPGLGHVGVDVNAGARNNQQSLRSGLTGPAGGQQPMQATQQQPQLPMGQTSLQQLARRLATSYGLAIGRDDLVDAQGNFNFTPDQLAQSAGGSETMGTAAAKLNYIASALQRHQTQQNLGKSEAALQAGLGLTGRRRSGSMIEQQSQYYMGLANLYQAQDYEAADFSYFIQKEKMDIEREMLRKAEKLAKSKAKAGFWGGLGMTALNIASGNYAGAIQSGIGTYESGASAGYF